jgi:hypothetical protein
MTILAGTGFGSSYTDPPAKGLLRIDPDDPYQYGVIPAGTSRSGVQLNTGGNGSSGFSACYLRTNGNSRMLKIAAIQGPFTVTVNYASNSSPGVHADIRFGDTEGSLYVGDDSASNSDYRTVSWPYAGTDIIPFVYIETKGSARIFDVIITPGAAYPYTEVPSGFAITGAASFIKGQTQTYTTDISQTLTNPVYEWEITDGSANAEIVRRADGESVELKALNPGQVTLQLTITTSNPYDPSVPPTTVTKTKAITIEGYTPIQSVSIDPTATVAEGGTVQLTATITPPAATSPAYEWSITGGAGNGAISSGGDAKTVTLSGITAQTTFTVKVKVTTRDPANPSNSVTVESNECTVTVTAPLQEVTWLFNATTAGAAGLTAGGDGYYNIPDGTDWGNGLTLLKRSGSSTNAIRPGQASGGITGCIQMGGAGDIAKITGVTAGSTVTLELKYSGTGSGQTDRYPTVTIGSSTTNADNTNGTNLITWTQNFTVSQGEDILLKANNGIRIYSIKIAK